MHESVKTTIDSLKKNGFSVEYFHTAKDAKLYLQNCVKPTESIGFSGSWTLKELELFESLKKQGNSVYWHWQPEDGETAASTLKKAMTTDIYMSGINGITKDGRIVNIDGTGNRLSSILFGHSRLYMIASTHKISSNYEEAMIRIKNEACPKNAKRLGLKTPCATLEKCTSCDSPDRMCNATLILERQPGGIPTTIILIDERLGF